MSAPSSSFCKIHSDLKQLKVELKQIKKQAKRVCSDSTLLHQVKQSKQTLKRIDSLLPTHSCIQSQAMTLEQATNALASLRAEMEPLRQQLAMCCSELQEASAVEILAVQQHS